MLVAFDTHDTCNSMQGHQCSCFLSIKTAVIVSDVVTLYGMAYVECYLQSRDTVTCLWTEEKAFCFVTPGVHEIPVYSSYPYSHRH